MDKIRKLFKLLEYTLQGKQFPMEKLHRKETANITVNSDKFEDPKEIADRESIRLKNRPTVSGDSGVESGMNF